MSYDRSPRAVCSTTIGIRFNARSFIVNLLTLQTLIRPRSAELVSSEKVAGLSVTLAWPSTQSIACCFEHLRLYLSHHVGVLQVGASHFIGV